MVCAIMLLLAQLYYSVSGLWTAIGFGAIILCLCLALLFFPMGKSDMKKLRNVFCLMSVMMILSANQILTFHTMRTLLLQIVMFAYPIALLNMPMSEACARKTEKVLGKTFVLLLGLFALLYVSDHLVFGEDGVATFLNMGYAITLFKSLFFLSFFWLISRRNLYGVLGIAAFNLLIGERTAALTAVNIYIV